MKYIDVGRSVIYGILTKRDELIKLTGAEDVESNPVEGGSFIVNNEIFGQFIEVQENKKIKMKQMLKDWLTGDFANEFPES